MTTKNPTELVRKFMTRVLATGSLLAIYAVGGIATTGIMVAAGASPAYAQRGGNRGGGGGNANKGGGGNRGGRGGGGKRRGGGNVGAAVTLGVGALIVGGVVAAQRQAEYDAAVRECQRTYGRNYILESKEFVGRDGGYYPCP